MVMWMIYPNQADSQPGSHNAARSCGPTCGPAAFGPQLWAHSCGPTAVGPQAAGPYGPPVCGPVWAHSISQATRGNLSKASTYEENAARAKLRAVCASSCGPTCGPVWATGPTCGPVWPTAVGPHVGLCGPRLWAHSCEPTTVAHNRGPTRGPGWAYGRPTPVGPPLWPTCGPTAASRIWSVWAHTLLLFYLLAACMLFFDSSGASSEHRQRFLFLSVVGCFFLCGWRVLLACFFWGGEGVDSIRALSEVAANY